MDQDVHVADQEAHETALDTLADRTEHTFEQDVHIADGPEHTFDQKIHVEQDVHEVVVAVDQGALVDHGVQVNRDDVPVDDVIAWFRLDVAQFKEHHKTMKQLRKTLLNLKRQRKLLKHTHLAGDILVSQLNKIGAVDGDMCKKDLFKPPE